MAFDPTLPANSSLISSAELRGQFNGLNDGLTSLNDAVSLLPTGTDVNAAILAGSAGPVGGVDVLALGVSDPPTQNEVQAIADKVDELITALKRL